MGKIECYFTKIEVGDSVSSSDCGKYQFSGTVMEVKKDFNVAIILVDGDDERLIDADMCDIEIEEKGTPEIIKMIKEGK